MKLNTGVRVVLLGLLAATVVYVLIHVVVMARVTAEKVRLYMETECTEDMPCWDCDTMGNLHCGLEQDETNMTHNDTLGGGQ
jgi:hypothetical protein